MNLDEKLKQCGIRPLRKSYLSLSATQVQDIESKVGPFPTEYRDVVMKYGGAIFDLEVYFAPADPRFREIAPDGRATLDFLFGDQEGDNFWDSNSLTANIEWMKLRMPETMIPIADSANDHICLGIRGADRGKVFYWDREGEPETVGYDNLYLIADSFGDFIAGLEPEES